MLQYTHMSHQISTPNKPRTASKDILARCMATEDITVQHSASAETAAFDTERRVLILPVWEDMDDSVYDMLVGHEVSHALHTPMEGWQDFIGDGSGARMRHMFCNVVEDARIERLIKAKFPGLRRDFAAAYKNLNERDLFELNGRSIDATWPLIDRLNLHFKLGLFGLVQIPFTADEQQYVTRMDETTTFEEVVELARELYEMQVENDEQDEEESGSQDAINGDASESGSEGEQSDDQGSGAGQDESDEDESGAGSSGGDEEGDDEESTGNGASESDGEDSGQSMSDDTDTGDSAESTSGESSEQGDANDLSYDNYSANTPLAGSTQNSFERGVSEMRDDHAGEYHYATLPTMNLDNCVCDFKKIEELWNAKLENVSASGLEHRANQIAELNTYMNSIKGIVGGMVQQFQMKQAADADKRTSFAKTGVLNTTTMINYRWSEDIFLKNEVHTDAKNHGMVMYIDWSGSMCGILKDTVEQLLVLVEFCRKVGIPYEVYAFSSNQYCSVEDYYSPEAEAERNNAGEQWTATADTDVRPHEFQLYNFLSSRMNKREFNAGLNNFWTLTLRQVNYGSVAPRCLSLGATPLNEAILCAMDMVPAFQRANGVQIVNTVFLTDGEGHGMFRGSYGASKTIITDKKTKKQYEIAKNTRHERGETATLLTMLRDKTGTNLVGIRLHDANNINYMRYSVEEEDFGRLQKEYKKNNHITLPSAYDEYFLVKGDLKVEIDAMESLEDDASMTRIKNAFIKGGTRKKASRVIANKMVDIFAV